MKETGKKHARKSDERMKKDLNSEWYQRGDHLSRQEHYYRQLRWRRQHIACLSSLETESPREADLLLALNSARSK